MNKEELKAELEDVFKNGVALTIKLKDGTDVLVELKSVIKERRPHDWVSNQKYIKINDSKLKYVIDENIVRFSCTGESPIKITFESLNNLLKLNEQDQMKWIRANYKVCERTVMYLALKELLLQKITFSQLEEIKRPLDKLTAFSFSRKEYTKIENTDIEYKIDCDVIKFKIKGSNAKILIQGLHDILASDAEEIDRYINENYTDGKKSIMKRTIYMLFNGEITIPGIKTKDKEEEKKEPIKPIQKKLIQNDDSKIDYEKLKTKMEGHRFETIPEYNFLQFIELESEFIVSKYGVIIEVNKNQLQKLIKFNDKELEKATQTYYKDFEKNRTLLKFVKAFKTSRIFSNENEPNESIKEVTDYVKTEELKTENKVEGAKINSNKFNEILSKPKLNKDPYLTATKLKSISAIKEKVDNKNVH